MYKPGDLCRLLRKDYAWNDREHKQAYPEFYPAIKMHSAKPEMIVEVVKDDTVGVGHVVVWVPQLNGYTFILPYDIEKIK
jgi:hypothetical protein